MGFVVLHAQRSCREVERVAGLAGAALPPGSFRICATCLASPLHKAVIGNFQAGHAC